MLCDPIHEATEAEKILTNYSANGDSRFVETCIIKAVV